MHKGARNSGTKVACAFADCTCGPAWSNVGTELVKAYGSAAVYIANVTAGSGVYKT